MDRVRSTYYTLAKQKTSSGNLNRILFGTTDFHKHVDLDLFANTKMKFFAEKEVGTESQ